MTVKLECISLLPTWIDSQDLDRVTPVSASMADELVASTHEGCPHSCKGLKRFA